jgi:two-component system response regulator DegU
MINILVCSSSVVFYTGLKSITLDEKDYQIAGWSQNSRELRVKYDKIDPQIVIVDYNDLNTGILNYCQEVKKTEKCLILILGKNAVLKNSQHELINGILPIGSAMELVESIRYFTKVVETQVELNLEESIVLTRRESEILQLLVKGQSTNLISQELAISNHTTKKHISNIFRKMNVKNRLQAAAKIFEGGYV